MVRSNQIGFGFEILPNQTDGQINMYLIRKYMSVNQNIDEQMLIGIIKVNTEISEEKINE